VYERASLGIVDFSAAGLSQIGCATRVDSLSLPECNVDAFKTAHDEKPAESDHTQCDGSTARREVVDLLAGGLLQLLEPRFNRVVDAGDQSGIMPEHQEVVRS
jgi:hypothetical protein